MTTPTHIAADAVVLLIIIQLNLAHPNSMDLVLLFGSNLIDLDHLFSRPIYHPKRNPFKTHPIHKRWLIASLVSIALILYRPGMFLGVGLLLHLFLDYLYIKREKL
jgi:hypothetical protein